MTRRFVAMGVPGDVRGPLLAALRQVMDRRNDLVWTDPGSWHVTLAFLGEVEDHRIVSVRTAVEHGVRAASAGSVVDLHVGTPARFGDRTLYFNVGDQPTSVLARLGESIQTQLASAGLPVQEQDVIAHLTLARGRHNGAIDNALVSEVADAIAINASARAWTAEQLAIWSTQPSAGPGPARYIVDEVVSLHPEQLAR